MATKAQVLKRAEQLGCKIDLNVNDVAIHAPKGMLVGGELHISVYDFEFTSKREAWNNLWSDMTYIIECEGSRYCTCRK